ncbi:DUF6153 family protein [Streptomyces himalayensis]|uniref:Uncharacterized protein n=2 Tax=Streptomyces himalayensis TaxID=2820085 RepID=A0A7W2HHN9_9ACTN|nr:DUF6153 family protein [Streptomyces himalayensis]MBA2948887.1 hypothetical protein [Streptomyces himalayensis subsp. himalayensis]MBA4864166.1 hypothetical protein [Streptomyces himalayensis subsp. aureolus]
MNVSRYVRTGGALGHLLLVVVLALGVFVMHTVGHPADSSAQMSTTSHASASTTDTAPAAHDPAEAHTSIGSSHATDPAQSSSAHMPAMSMDTMSLCLAVLLGAWVLATLLRAALARRRGGLANLLTQGPVAQRPNPPPRGPDLTQLSVLRL